VRLGLEEAGKLGAGQAMLHAREVGLPRGMNRLWILFPMPVHFLCIICIVPFAKGSFGEGGVTAVARLWWTMVGRTRPGLVALETPGKRRIAVRGIIFEAATLTQNP